ncbi:MAG: FAD-dependent oxidoreductase [Oscillospiraceae bacterium]|nr:FAD-dependent oxidoreductase [Oscillospiraceae bacterium]
MDFIHEKKETPVCNEYDVIVVGGGIAGVAAALAASRNGSKVLLVEKTTMLGGLATAGLIVIYLPICDGMGHKIHSGICEELLYASIKYGNDSLPEQWRGGAWAADTKERYQTAFNAPAFMIALDELVREANVDVLLDTVFCDVVMEQGRCTAVIVENKSGRQAYRCKAVVDASGDADVMYQAGAPCHEQDNFCTLWAYCQSDNEELIFKLAGLPPDFVKIIAIGSFSGAYLPPNTPKYRGTDVHQVTEFMMKGREGALRRLKDDPSLTYITFPSQAQYRTTRRIKGEHTLLTKDAGRHFDDSIGTTGIWNIPGPVYEIPFGTLKAKGIENIFAAGRIISAANGSGWEITRVIPVCALTGQAAGTAAAIAAITGEAPIGDVQKALKKDGLVLTMSDMLVEQSEKWLENSYNPDSPLVKDLPDGKVWSRAIS